MRRFGYVILMVGCAVCMFSQPALSRSINDAGGNLNKVTDLSGLPKGDVETRASSAINTVLSLVGLIFFILAVYAGFLWMTAQGEESSIEKARNTLIAASVGLSVTVAAYGITSFVITSLQDSLSESPNQDTPGEQTDVNGDVIGETGCCVDLISERSGNYAGYPATESTCETRQAEEAAGPNGTAWEWYGGKNAASQCSAITRCWNLVEGVGNVEVNRKKACLDELSF